MKIRVIGVGSSIAGDDAVGIAVVRRLSKMDLPRNVDLVECDTPGICLFELVKGVDKVIIVDALVGGDNPGGVRKLRMCDLSERNRIVSAHDLGTVEALKLSLALQSDKTEEQIMIIGVEVPEKLLMGGGLSSVVEAAVPEAVKVIVSELQ